MYRSDVRPSVHGLSVPSIADGAYSAPPEPLAVFNGPASKGRDRKKERERGKEREREGKRWGRERRCGASPQIFWPTTAPESSD